RPVSGVNYGFATAAPYLYPSASRDAADGLGCIPRPLEFCVADIFREIDEEVRRERLKQLWDRYSAIIVGLAVLVIVGVGGWRGYEWWQAKQASEAGAIFESAVVLSEQGKHEEAYTAFAAIAERGGAYRVLA